MVCSLHIGQGVVVHMVVRYLHQVGEVWGPWMGQRQIFPCGKGCCQYLIRFENAHHTHVKFMDWNKLSLFLWTALAYIIPPLLPFQHTFPCPRGISSLDLQRQHKKSNNNHSRLWHHTLSLNHTPTTSPTIMLQNHTSLLVLNSPWNVWWIDEKLCGQRRKHKQTVTSYSRAKLVTIQLDKQA